MRLSIDKKKRGSSKKLVPASKPVLTGEIAKTAPPSLSEIGRPMLATLVKDAFNDAEWLFELKWDGYRAIASVHDGKVELQSRNNISFNSRYAPLVAALRLLPISAILDGEIIILNENGISDFQQLQSWQKTGKGNLVYYVFDLLWLNGKPLMDMPLKERKKILENRIPAEGPIKYSDHIFERGKDFYELALHQGLEGIMAKKADSTYRPGLRSTQWLKIKTHQTQEAVIAGFTKGRGGRKHFGALILGMYEHNEFVYIGHTGSGLNDKGLVQLYKKLEPLITDNCPFAKKPKTNMAPTWVKPVMVCEVKFQEWTKDNILRIPIFLRMREDKNARQIKKEKSMYISPAIIDVPVVKPRAGSKESPALPHSSKSTVEARDPAIAKKPQKRTGKTGLT